MLLQTHTVVVGAGPAGLATAACLKNLGVPYVLVDKATSVGSKWLTHYERLHLHTTRNHSALPFTPFPKSYPTYPSRDQVSAYLIRYAQTHELEPQLGQAVTAIKRLDGEWQVSTSSSGWLAQNVVICTGYNQSPNKPHWPGQDTFEGTVLHSGDYLNASPFVGQRVLVVGLGNTGGEIAVDLNEGGASVSLSVRSPVRVVPRDTLGVPSQIMALIGHRLPLAVQDVLGRIGSRSAFGDLSPYGLKEPDIGPASQVVLHQKIPLIDVGTVELIKNGDIKVFGGVASLSKTGVVFSDGSTGDFDTIITATGYAPALGGLLEVADAVTDHRGYPKVTAGLPTLPGLYFVGFANPTTGFLRQIGRDAKAVARHIHGHMAT